LLFIIPVIAVHGEFLFLPAHQGWFSFWDHFPNPIQTLSIAEEPMERTYWLDPAGLFNVLKPFLGKDPS